MKVYSSLCFSLYIIFFHALFSEQENNSVRPMCILIDGAMEQVGRVSEISYFTKQYAHYLQHEDIHFIYHGFKLNK
jgi:hypothetical protein